MQKEKIRKEFFKLKFKGHSYLQCRKILMAKYQHRVTIRTLKRWIQRLDAGNWDLRDCSRRPHKIYPKITFEMEQKIIILKKKTGWGEDKIVNFVDLSHTSINKILNKHNLCSAKSRTKKRINYVRWQRKNPNSLWQIDHSDQKVKDKWLLSVLDDCSRYSIALIPLNQVTTIIVTHILDNLINYYGKPREILTDNGGAYGLKSKHSKFDRWCRRKDIKHIRSAVHSPTTCGKVERLFQTLKNEIKYCDNDPELFRMRYNHFRPHTSLHKKTPAEIYFHW